MQYPIFNSIIKKIQTELNAKEIKPGKFRVWRDTTIHAIGLETGIDLSHENAGISQLMINFDWDKFREASLANQLVGMEKHPLLPKDGRSPYKINPTIDVEVSWHFDTDGISNTFAEATSDERVDYASKWMGNINRHLNRVLPTERLISRWHLDVATDHHGKYVTSMCLITYFQYSLKGMQDLNTIHNQVTARLETILNRSSRIIQLVKETRPLTALSA